MKTLRVLFSVLLTLNCLPVIYAQDSHVHVRHSDDGHKTLVQTEWMYLLNTPQQLVQATLNSQFEGQRLPNTTDKVDLLIDSFSREVLYRDSKTQALLIKTDGESWSVNPKTYTSFKGETKKGQDIFWQEKRSLMGLPSRLPATAQIKEEEGVNGLFMEELYYQLTLEQLQKITNAKTVEVQLGTSPISFSINQANTIRGFQSLLNPSLHSIQGGTETALENSASPVKSGVASEVDAGILNGHAIKLPQPGYSASARTAHATGRVAVFVTVDEQGKVIAARAISGHPLLRGDAEAAAKRARFTQTFRDGQPVKFTGTIIYDFLAL